MSLKLLQSIQEAEARAEAVRAEAQREAREMLKTVEEVCVGNERQAVLEQRALAQRTLQDAKAAAQRRIAAAALDETAARDALLDAARARLNEAAERIFERVVHDGHR